MFRLLSILVTRGWPFWLAGWAVTLLVLAWVAPPWRSMAKDEDFALLPVTAPSRQAAELFARAFPDDRSLNNIVVVSSRANEHLTAADSDFISNTLAVGLLKIAEDEGGLANAPVASDDSDPFAPPPPPSNKPRSIIAQLQTPDTPGVGALLKSPDGKAALVVLELTTEIMTHQNWPTIDKVKELVANLQQKGQVPQGLALNVTGSAVIGQDYSHAQLQSARSTEWWTLFLVVGLLLLTYRAPLLAVIPLVTVFIAVRLALYILALLAQAGWVHLFQGIDIYITVVAYGAGVDYCLFLVARTREEMATCIGPREAIGRAITSVGGALTASAATVMFGIGMMAFAEFGKFREAGIAMPLSLLLVLCATLTFTAPLLCLAGKWAFWPEVPCQDGRIGPPTGAWAWLWQVGDTHGLWVRLGHALSRRPAAIWLGTVVLLAPFAVTALLFPHPLTYDFIGDLPSTAPGVVGARALQQHFPAGITGPLTVVLSDPHANFREKADRQRIKQWTQRLTEQREQLGLADIRSLTAPLGITGAAQNALTGLNLPPEEVKVGVRKQALQHYASEMGERGYTVTRLELVFTQDAFAHASVDRLEEVEQAVRAAWPGPAQDMQLAFVGTTASVRDLRDVTNRDQLRIALLVVSAVFIILVVLLRDLVVSVYLILSVLFSYFVTLGVTLLVFWAFNPSGFTGLDWKVGVFLFTILIAVGEDYNIFLMTRVHEEERQFGHPRGLVEALTRTGPIISSCGVIMAGTFASLGMGPLAEMHQLAFALVFGVLLDTFVVRPILVPCFLLLLNHPSPRAVVANGEQHPGEMLAGGPGRA